MVLYVFITLLYTIVPLWKDILNCQSQIQLRKYYSRGNYIFSELIYLKIEKNYFDIFKDIEYCLGTLILNCNKDICAF